MTPKELINVFKYIVKKCDMLINNGDYEADAYTQDTVEDIAELCNHILDGDYGKLVEVKEVDLEKSIQKSFIYHESHGDDFRSDCQIETAFRTGFEDGFKCKGYISKIQVNNLEEEIKRYFNEQPITTRSKGVDYKLIPSAEKIAKHFFELGLKARIDKELVEEVYSHIDSIKDTADRMTSGNFMHNRAAIKFSANTIAKVLELMGLKAQKGE